MPIEFTNGPHGGTPVPTRDEARADEIRESITNRALIDEFNDFIADYYRTVHRMGSYERTRREIGIVDALTDSTITFLEDRIVARKMRDL